MVIEENIMRYDNNEHLIVNNKRITSKDFDIFYIEREIFIGRYNTIEYLVNDILKYSNYSSYVYKIELIKEVKRLKELCSLLYYSYCCKDNEYFDIDKARSIEKNYKEYGYSNPCDVFESLLYFLSQFELTYKNNVNPDNVKLNEYIVEQTKKITQRIKQIFYQQCPCME